VLSTFALDTPAAGQSPPARSPSGPLTPAKLERLRVAIFGTLGRDTNIHATVAQMLGIGKPGEQLLVRTISYKEVAADPEPGTTWQFYWLDGGRGYVLGWQNAEKTKSQALLLDGQLSTIKGIEVDSTTKVYSEMPAAEAMRLTPIHLRRWSEIAELLPPSK
jgi:hypothetical protein